MLPFEEVDALVKSLQPNCMLMNIGCAEGLARTDMVFYENAAGQEVDNAFEGPGVSCNKLTNTWFWRATDPTAELISAEWAIEKMKTYFPMNVNFMLNLSPNLEGRIDENLMERFQKIGELVAFPKSLEKLPPNWLKRE